MDLLFWGLTTGILGKVILGMAVVSVHWKIVKEHKIDQEVIGEVNREKHFAILGMFFIIIGYILQAPFKF